MVIITQAKYERKWGERMKRSAEVSCILNSLKEAGLVPSEQEQEFCAAIKNGLKQIRIEKTLQKRQQKATS